MADKEKNSNWFAFKIALRRDHRWEDEEKTVYTVEALREEMRQRLSPPVKKTKDRS